MAVRFRLLGDVAADIDGREIELGHARQRCVLAALLVDANRLVPVDQLLDRVWGDSPPQRARGVLYNYLSRLRHALASDVGAVISRGPGGYRCTVDATAVDLHLFRSLVAQAQATAPDVDAVELLDKALRLWQGEPFAGLDTPWVNSVREAVERERMVAELERNDITLRLGRHGWLVGTLATAAEARPLDERLHGQLILALYRDGRPADALAAYQRIRRRLVAELGADPSPSLRELHQRVLAADPTLAAVPVRTNPSPVPHGLPPAPGSFIGRTEELARLDAMLNPPNQTDVAMLIVTICGTAGVGKTALALRWAHRVAARFPDGQLYVNLAGHSSDPPVRPISALAQLLRALGVTGEQVPSNVDEATGLLRSLLAGRQVLVVLDNVRDAEHVRPLLPGSGGCGVLLTSRDRLTSLVAREGASRLLLDVLPAADAHALLAEMIGQSTVAAEPEATAELARVCAYLPLALRIAAANLTDHPHRGVAGHVAELRDGNRLEALAVDGDERGAVRAAFELSYTSLDPPDAHLFRLLGVAPGPDMSLVAAASLTGTLSSATGQRLNRLMGAHLVVQQAAGRYTFHDLLRIYAGECSEQHDTAAERAEAMSRLYDHYLYTVDAAARSLYPTTLRLPVTPADAATPAFDDHTQALAWLDAERQNLLAVISRAATEGPRPVAYQLADGLRGYFWLRMYTIDWDTAATAALSAAEAEGDETGQAATHLSLADLYSRRGDYAGALEHNERALKLAQQADWVHGQAAAQGGLGNVYWRIGQLQRAAECHGHALSLNRRTNRLAGQAVNLANLANAYRELGRLNDARDNEVQALAIYRRVGSRHGEAATLGNLGETLHLLGQHIDAREHLDQALALHREVGDRGVEAETLARLAAVHRDLGQYEAALHLARTAVELTRQTGEQRYETDALNILGSIECAHGRDGPAIEHHQRAYDLSVAGGIRYQQTEALLGLAAAYRRGGQYDEALAYARQAARHADETGYQLLAGRAANALAEIGFAASDVGRASQHPGHVARGS